MGHKQSRGQEDCAQRQLSVERSSSSGGSRAVLDRPSRRSALCEQAFLWVDALQTGCINTNQSKTALIFVFQQLGDVPMPKDEWYVQVFRNFAYSDGTLLDIASFKEIVLQWDEHHMQKGSRASGGIGSQHTRTRSGGSTVPRHFSASGICHTQPVPYNPSSCSQTHEVDDVDQLDESYDLADGLAREADASGVSRRESGAWQGEREEGVMPAKERAAAIPLRPERVSAVQLPSEVMFPTYIGRLAIFDDYEFYNDVGSGSFGKVMVVRHRNTKQLRACKVVTVQTVLQRELIDTEIKLLKSLNHPNIMTLYEVYFEQGLEQKITNGNIYLITELCEGGDLFSRIIHHYEKLKQRMTESLVAFMMQQILSATKYCHDRDIIHRDIKPENILFVDRSSSSPVKIIDFGLANFTEKIRESAKEVKIPRTGVLGRLARMLPAFDDKHLIPWHERRQVMQRAGTAHYMAPEMIEGYYDEKADLFSIGIILCQLLTGWHPFFIPRYDDEQSVKRKIISENPVQFPAEIWRYVSKEAQDLCRALLEKNSKKRFSAAQALATPWFRDPAKPSAFGNVDSLSVSIFEGLVEYQAQNKLKRAVLQLLTRELSEFQTQELRDKFMALDTQGDGLLSPEELAEGMRHVGYQMSEAELKRLVASLDGSGRQRIGYKEFVSALLEQRVRFDQQQLSECFKKFDRNNQGYITYADVIAVIQMTESEWLQICLQNGRGGGTLYFDEFVTLMMATADS